MQRIYKLLIFSLFLLNVYLWVVFCEDTYGFPKIIKYGLSLLVFGTIIYFRLVNPSKPTSGILFFLVIITFIIWSIILLILESMKFNTLFYLQRILGQPFFYIPYVLPLILLFTAFNLDFFRFFFHYSFILIIFSIIIQLYIILTGISQTHWDEQVYRIGIFDIGGSFLLLTAHLSKKRSIYYFSLVYSLLMIFLYSEYGRRGMLLEYAIIMFFMLAIQLKSSILNFSDRTKIYLAGLLMLTMIVFFGSIAKSSYVFQRGGFGKSAIEESRGIVFDDFFYDFKSASDWIFGRGLEGRVLRSINLDEGTSDVIENGFLTIIIKGGLLYLVPFLIILLRASYLGFFNSNNDLAKALASLLLIYVISMLYFNIPVYSTKFIFTWIAASACLTPEVRNYTNSEIFQFINLSIK